MPETNIVVSFVGDLLDRAKGLMQQNRASLNAKQADKTTQQKADDAAQGSQKEGRPRRQSNAILRPTAIGGNPPSLAQYWTTTQYIDESGTFGYHNSSDGESHRYRIGIGCGDGTQWQYFEYELPKYNRFAGLVCDGMGSAVLNGPGFKFEYPFAKTVFYTSLLDAKTWRGTEERIGYGEWTSLPAGRDAIVAVYRWRWERKTHIGSWVDAVYQGAQQQSDTEEGAKCFYVTQSSLVEILAPQTLIDALDNLRFGPPYGYYYTEPATPPLLNHLVGVTYDGFPDDPTYKTSNPTHPVLNPSLPVGAVGGSLTSVSLRAPYSLYMTGGTGWTQNQPLNWWGTLPTFPTFYKSLIDVAPDESLSYLLMNLDIDNPSFIPLQWEKVSADLSPAGIRAQYALLGLVGESTTGETTFRGVYNVAPANQPLWTLIQAPGALTGEALGYFEDVEIAGWRQLTERNYTSLSELRVSPESVIEGPTEKVYLSVKTASDGGDPARCQANLVLLGF